MLQTLLLATLALLVAVGGGTASAWFLARRGNPLPDGRGWHALPSRSELIENPYRPDPAGGRFALDAKAGERKLLLASRSDDGAPLDGNCTYQLAGRFPIARIWTLSALDASFRPLSRDPAGLNSSTVVWQADGSVAVTVGAEPASGNWLALDRAQRGFVLLVGLYDTPLVEGAEHADVPFPPIVRLRCREQKA